MLSYLSWYLYDTCPGSYHLFAMKLHRIKCIHVAYKWTQVYEGLPSSGARVDLYSWHFNVCTARRANYKWSCSCPWREGTWGTRITLLAVNVGILWKYGNMDGRFQVLKCLPPSLTTLNASCELEIWLFFVLLTVQLSIFIVLLTVQLSIFILVINQLDAHNFLFYNKFIVKQKIMCIKLVNY